MNYFELLGIEPHLMVDLKGLKKSFLMKSKTLHPDVSDVVNALDLSAQLNQAFETLKVDHKRIKYVLETYSEVSLEKATLPPMFLMEMMEVNERVEEVAASDSNKVEEVQEEIAQLEADIWKELQPIMEKWHPDDWQSDELLDELRQGYFKLKYILRLKETVGRFASS
jgi:molecular chaperone HscB